MPWASISIGQAVALTTGKDRRGFTVPTSLAAHITPGRRSPLRGGGQRGHRLGQHRCGRGVIQVRHLIRYPDSPESVDPRHQ
jgi:hypothetical protein